MAVAFTSSGGGGASSTDTTSYAGLTATPAAGDLLLCFVVASDTVAAGTMTGTWTWTLLKSFTFNGGADTVYVFYAFADSATSTTPTFDCTGDTATGAIVYWLRVTGSYGQKVPVIRQFKTATGNGANPSVTLDYAPLTENGCVGIYGKKTVNGTGSSPTSWTTAFSLAYSTPNTRQVVSYRASGETSATITWTQANAGNWGVLVLELWADPMYKSIGGGQASNSPMFY